MDYIYKITNDINNKIYLLGGHKGAYVKQIFEFEIDSKTTTTLSITLPTNEGQRGVGVVGNKAYLFGGSDYSKTILEFSTVEDFYILEFNKLYIQNNLSTPQCKLINSDSLEISGGVEKCYLGNSENIAEEQTVAIHNGTEWQEI